MALNSVKARAIRTANYATVAVSLPPGPVSLAPSITGTNASSVALTWGAPALGGLPSTYIVEYKLSSASAWTAADQGSAALGTTIFGLTAATSYDFRVRAANIAGLGVASPSVTVSTAAAGVVAPDTTVTTDLSNPDRGLNPLI